MNQLVETLADFLSGSILVPILIPVGIWFTLRMKGLQFTNFAESWRCAFENKSKDKSAVSSFQAMMVSTAARVGTGNIVGVCTAICLGGFGSVFWMWVMALFGMATAFVESTLAQIYKERSSDGSGTCKGGPAYYMEHGLGSRKLGVIFSVLLFLTFGFGFNVLISYNVVESFAIFYPSSADFHATVVPYIIIAVLTLGFAFCVFRGGQKTATITGVLTPVMGVIYILMAIVVIVLNIGNLPGVFARIFREALDFKAIFGGFSGSCMMLGIKRGLFSNEAGLGSAPNAAAAAEVSHPVKQGMAQMVSVFIDTIVICSATALMGLCSGVEPTAELAGIAYVQTALGSVFGGSFGYIFMCLAMVLFGFTTLLGDCFYTEPNLKFILNRDLKKGEKIAFYTFATLQVPLGAFMTFTLVWNLADLMNAITALMNIPVILILSRKVYICLADYKAQKKEGLDPVFHASKLGIQNAEYWD